VTDRQRKKQRDYRRRQACGLAVLRVPIELHPVLEGLVAANRLSPGECLERTRVEHAIGDLVMEWVSKWRS
jgi:hypothetical protein